MERAQSASDASSCRTTRLIAGPTQLGGARWVMTPATERRGHDVAVVVVEQVSRREEALGAGAADEDEVVPVEVALERQDRADDELDRDQDDGGQSNPVCAGQPDCHTSFLLVGGSLRCTGRRVGDRRRRITPSQQLLRRESGAFTLDE